MNLPKIKELLEKYGNGQCTDAEREIVEQWYQQLKNTGSFEWKDDKKKKIKASIEKVIRERTGLQKQGKVHSIPKRRIYWYAAASVAIIAISLIYFRMLNQPSGKNTDHIAQVTNDVKAPEASRAMVTLADGTKVYLDSAGTGNVAVQGNMKLVKLPSGEIAYQNASGELSTKLVYNTLSNPRGSKVIQMVLADGSKVWLNAGSALTYPVAFVGKERSVSITGEAYFEVAHDASKPFTVFKDKVAVKVLGTHFNINAFQDDGDDIEVTLLEGSVNVSVPSPSPSERAGVRLKPGEQARVGKGLKVVTDVDVNGVMAWKNGYFHFDDASLQNVMERISRWYDVKVVYKGEVPKKRFAGEMQRDLSLSEIIQILERNKIHFEIVGKELIVSQ